MGYYEEVDGLKIYIESNDEEMKGRQKNRLELYAKMIAIRGVTGMNRKEFAEWLGIPYRTISDWELGKRKMPDYVLRLIAYKVKKEYGE